MKTAVLAVAAVCFVAIAILLLSWTTYFTQLNYAAYDFTLRLAGPLQPSSPTVIVAIDEDSLARDAWPWSRDKVARVIELVGAGQPRVIALDLIVDDRTTPEEDASLASAISNARSIVLSTHMDTVNASNWRKPNPQFNSPHVRLGHVHADPDFDGITRRIYSAKVAGGAAYSAFSIETLRSAGVSIPGDFEIRTGGANILRPAALNIRYIGDNKTFQHVPAWQVLDGQIPPDRFKDKIVLIGSTAEGVGDQWFTPFAERGQRMSGVEIHANAIETLYANRIISESSDLSLFFALLAFVGLLTLADLRFEGKGFYALAVLAGPLVIGVSWLLMKQFNLWFPFPPFLSAIAMVVPTLEVMKIVRVNRDLDEKIIRLSTVFNKYESEYPGSEPQRTKLRVQRRQDARWKLEAVDYFNEELVRFLSFNNAVLASIEDVIIVSDSTDRVVYQNPAAAKLDGYLKDPPAARKYIAALLDYPGFSTEYAEALEHQHVHTISSAPSRNGRDFYNVTLSPIANNGIVCSFHNATAQHDLNQAKNDMVSLVSHELRTPLTSIRGYSDMLLKYDLVQDKGKQFLGTILDESKRLNELIQSFLDIAYIESGRNKIMKTDFEIEPVLTDMLSILGPVAKEKGIALECPPGLNGTRARGDRLLLYQALTNLMTNAIKYSPAGTTVRIGVSNGDGSTRFHISDQGFGIPREEMTRIFEKFYRRGNVETREQSGFGLGLAFVKEVATRHSGDVIVESEPGKGSVFTLWIPN